MQRALLLGACSFFVGVWWRSLAPVDMYATGALLIIAGFVALVSIMRSFHVGVIVALMACGLVLGVVRAEFAYRAYVEGRVYSEGAQLVAQGVVDGEPDVREEHANITITVQEGDTRSRFIARVPHAPTFTYGDRVSLRGTAHVPEAFTTDTGRTFAYDGYLMKDGIHYELRNAVVTPTTENAGNRIVRGLFNLKSTWLTSVSRSIPEPSSSLLGGLVVGAKQSLGESWLQAFRETGLIHIVVLSGYNLTIIAIFIIWLTKVFSRRIRLMLGLAGIVGFALMTGAGATVVRASIMASLALLAQFLARPYVILRALLIAALMMVLYNPLVLVFDSGFQLSFIATLGLVTISPLFERHMSIVPNALGIRTIVAATLATQLSVLPLLLYHIGNASLVAPIVNVLVLPLVPVIMAVGFVTGVLGIFSNVMAGPLAFITNAFLSYIFAVVHFFQAFSFASVSLPPVPFWTVALLYGIGGLYVYRTYKNHSPTVREASGDMVSSAH